MELVQQLARPLINFIVEAIPVVVNTCQMVYQVYSRLPIKYIQLIIGTVMCFFGGFYPTVFAALQVSFYRADEFCNARMTNMTQR